MMNIELLKGDITKIEIDIIVNAANISLLGGGGVDGAIHKAGGGKILEECIEIRKKQGGCSVGQAVITNAGNLKAKRVIHTVGPIWSGGTSREGEKLKDCYINSLKLAETAHLNSIAFPNISTGIFGFPKDKAAKIAIEAVTNFQSDTVKKVVFVCFDEENYRLYADRLKGL